MAHKSTIALRLNEEQVTDVAGLQVLTGEATASKAILTAVRRHPHILQRALDLDDQLTEVREQLDVALGEVAVLQAGLDTVQSTIDEINRNREASQQAEMNGFEQGQG